MNMIPPEMPLDIDNPPSPSCIWKRYGKAPTTYQLMHEQGNKTIFLIKEKEGKKYILLSRSLPSSVSFNDVYSSFLEEMEMLTTFYKKGFFVPKLVDADTSEVQSFWDGTTFYVDFLFELEGAESEITLMKQQVLKMSTLPSVQASDFRKLADLAQIQQQLLELNIPPGFLTEGTCLAKSAIMTVNTEEGVDSESSRAPASPDKEWELLLLSAGILDRQLEKSGTSDEEIVRENQKFIMENFCHIVSGVDKKLEGYLENTSALTAKFKPDNEEEYKAKLSEMLIEMIHEKPTSASYTKLEEFLHKFSKTEKISINTYYYVILCIKDSRKSKFQFLQSVSNS